MKAHFFMQEAQLVCIQLVGVIKKWVTVGPTKRLVQAPALAGDDPR